MENHYNANTITILLRLYYADGIGQYPARKRLLTGTVPVNNSLLTGTVPVNNFLLTGTVPVNNSLLTGTGSLSIISYLQGLKINIS